MAGRTLERILATGIIPVVRAPSKDLAARAIDAILAGGIDIVEVTMTVPGALELMGTLSARFGDDVVVGAGTVLDAQTARECIDAGAGFVVSPILDVATIEACRARGAVVLPGALTPTEVVRAIQAGADLVKVFPCGALGGASYVRALKAPLPEARLVPTGGVSLETVGDFIRAGASAVGVGADLVDLVRIKEGRDATVTESARKYIEAIAAARRSGR